MKIGEILGFLNCSVNELSEYYGDDYIVEEGLYFGGLQRIYYEDKRVWAIFAYNSQTPNIRPNGNEIIKTVFIYKGTIGGTVVENLDANMTTEELKSTGYFKEQYYDNILECAIVTLDFGELVAEYCFKDTHGVSEYAIFSVGKSYDY